MKIWSLCRADTGEFVGRTIACSPAQLAAQTPAGMLAVEGRHDHLCRRLNLQTGEVEPYQPPAPADDDLRTWAWDAEAERWAASPTLTALRLAKLAELKAARDAQQFGGFVWDGSPFDSDARSQSVLLGMFTTAALGSLPDTPFRLQDNSWRLLSAADMVQVWGALQALIAGVFAQFAALEAEVYAAATAEEIAAVSWPA